MTPRQNYSYHTHTHALERFDGKNTATEMIAQAEAIGFTELGITNHLCYHPNLPLSNPMCYNDLRKAVDDYQQILESIRTAASKSKIKVYAGFEVDFFPSKAWRDDFERINSQIKADYYIGSSHYIRNSDESELINPYDVFFCGCSSHSRSNIERLFGNCWDNIIESIRSGYFAFIAHIDLYKIFNLGTTPEWDQAKMRVIETLADYQQPYELNTSGWNKSAEQHPIDWMLKELNRRNVPVVISDDAHSTAMLAQHYDRAETLLQDMNYQNRWKL